MKHVWRVVLCCTMVAGAAAQAAPHGHKKAQEPAPVSHDELAELKSALQAQQQQLQQALQQIQQLQQRLDQGQAATQQAQSQAAAAQQVATEQGQSLSSVQSTLTDIRTALASSAVGYQDEQKKLSGLEGLVNRFRFTGDIRVRYENFFQGSANGTTFFNPRHRERIRVRFGVEGKLGADFIAGAAVASGILADPTSSNDTFTNNFERKTVGWDRGYITYNPVAHPWLSLTGGKFAYTWQRTSLTMDPDINPEGFSEQLAFDLKGPVLKNLTFTAMQLFINENNGTYLGNAGAPFTDSFAVGGQLLAKVAIGKRISVTPSFALLNWRNPDILLNEPFSSQPGPTPLPVPSPGGTGTFAANGMTNGTYVGADGKTHFRSRFLYADFIDNVVVKTGWDRLPFNLMVEFEQNLNAVNPCTPPFGPSPCAPGTLGDQNQAYGFEASLGQLRNKGDFQAGYSWWRIEQDAILASFAESDQRAPSNILQNRIFALYKLRKNTTLSYTFWFGRYLNTNLPHPNAAPGLTPGQVEPKLRRMSFDVIYAF